METEKLYSPLSFYLRDKEDAENGVYDEMEYWRDELSHEEAFEYIHHLEAFLARDRKDYDTGRGLAEYIDPGLLGDKVRSLVPYIELHGDKLWIVAYLRLKEPLSPPELLELKDWWEGQLSDGVGESWEQREIKVDRGELYLEPWTSDDRFFIDTQREFSKRLGLETPAQAALHEPDIFDDDATAALHKQLIERLDKNLLSYFDELHTNQALSITGMSSEIAAVAGAHYYMSEIHNFHTSELEYLLQFQNPLQVVGNAFQISGMDDYSDVMWDIFDRQDALQGGYPLVTDIADETELRRMLFDRLGKNLSDNLEHLNTLMRETDLSRDQMLRISNLIVANGSAYQCLTTDYEFRQGDIEAMLQLQNPLTPIADHWVISSNATVVKDEVVHDVIDRVNANQDCRAAAGAPPVKDEAMGKAADSPKRSILEQLRDAAKAPKEPHKDKPPRDKSGPER